MGILNEDLFNYLSYLLNYLFLFQELIKRGDLSLIFGNVITITIENHRLAVDVRDLSSLKGLFNIFQSSKESEKFKKFKSLFDKIDDLKYFLNNLSKIADLFVKYKKTFILKYRGEDVLIIGYEVRGGLFFKHIKIVNKLTLIKMINELKS
ncbi:MAG: hypothetical protein GXN95_02830 [Methanococci archaeon]|nr:hypothetical protein [Methanococci archaeon]